MSIQINVDWNIQDAINKKLNTEKLKTAMKKAMTQEAIDMETAIRTEIKETAYDTGKMMNSESHEVNSDGDTVEFLIKNSTNYWTYVNFGTSKMSPRNFVQNALGNENPADKVAKNFMEFYKS